MTQIIRLPAITLALVSVVTLAACSNRPSERDAKTAIQARIGDCDYLHVSDFSKVNGIQINENAYQVEVKYTLTLTPTADMKQRATALNADRARLADLRRAHDAEIAGYKANEDAWVQAHEHDPDTSISSRDPADPTRVVYPVQLGESGARTLYIRDHGNQINGDPAATAYGNEQERVYQEGNITIFANDLHQACPNVQWKTLGQAFHGVNASTDLTQAVQNQWDETINMIKTDNGWQEAQ